MGPEKILFDDWIRPPRGIRPTAMLTIPITTPRILSIIQQLSALLPARSRRFVFLLQELRHRAPLFPSRTATPCRPQPPSRNRQVLPPYAQFSVPGVATGTWIVFIDSGSTSAEIDTVTVVSNSTTSVPNAVDDTWPAIRIRPSYPQYRRDGNDQRASDRCAWLRPILGDHGDRRRLQHDDGSQWKLFSPRVATGTYNVVANPGQCQCSICDQDLSRHHGQYRRCDAKCKLSASSRRQDQRMGHSRWSERAAGRNCGRPRRKRQRAGYGSDGNQRSISY